MKIGVDIRPLQLSSKISGTGVYIKNLLAALSRTDKKNSYFLLSLKNRPQPDLDMEEGFNYEKVFMTSMPLDHLNVVRDRMVLPGVIRSFNPDVMHFTSPLELKLHYDAGSLNQRVVVTILDLTPVYYGEILFYGRRRLLKPVYCYLLNSIKKAARVAAISKNTKNDLVKELDYDPDKVAVTYLGKDEIFRPISDRNALKSIREKYNLPGRFVFYLGGFSRHKNLFRLLDAMKTVIVDQGVETPLVVAGKIDQYFYEDLLEKIDSLGLQPYVHFPGYIPLQDLPDIYNLAEAFVFPSLYEGFGLPVLEAMACGTPVVCSNTSSIPEVAGDAGIYFDPENTSEIAKAILSVIRDEKLRSSKTKKGLLKASEFTWRGTALQTLKVYEEIGGMSH